MPFSALRVASAALDNPANRHRAVPITYDQFRYAFANAVSEEEARQLYETFAVPAPGLPLFQAAAAKEQQHNEGVTEITKIEGRGHALTIDGGWREVADTALAFVRRFRPPQPVSA